MTFKKIPRLFTSFTAKIFALLFIVGSAPAVASAFLFDQVAEFNQNLQREAEHSIDAVSDVYRAWAAGVKTSNNAVRITLRNDIDRTLQIHGITSTEQLLADETFKYDATDRIQRRMSENPRLIEFEMQVDQKPYLLIKAEGDHENLMTDKMFSNIPLDKTLDKGFPKFAIPENNNDTVVLDATAEITDSKENAVELPSTLTDQHTERQRLFNSPVELTITVGFDREITDAFEKLGERRSLHTSISAMEDNENTQLQSLYRRFYLVNLILLSILVIGASFLIVLPLSNRLSKLANATARVAEGDLETKVEVKGDDQVAYLAHRFNDMIRDLKSAQDNRAYIERMQAWQEVARRLAHEIKNPLTPMMLAMQQLDKKFDDYVDNPKKYRRLMDDVMEIVNEEAATLQKLVKEFSSFARLPVPDRKSMPFFDFVKTTVQQNPQFQEDAKRCTVHEASDAIKAREASLDKELMRRVIVNIIKNGIEAAQNAHIEPEIDVEVREKPDEKTDKQNLWLMVVDNGPGLTAEQKEKIFNPYFTTKSDGTGLGLVIVRKIVQDHDGDISLHDRDDGERGTQVDIVLR